MQAQITFLVRIDDYLLVFECFPEVSWDPQPGYTLRVYSKSTLGNEAKLEFALLRVAELWGLNPAKLPSRHVRHHFCKDVGHQAGM